jgi:hypothetical protein
MTTEEQTIQVGRLVLERKRRQFNERILRAKVRGMTLALAEFLRSTEEFVQTRERLPEAPAFSFPDLVGVLKELESEHRELRILFQLLGE